MTNRRKTIQMMNMGFLFILATILPWSQLLGASMGASVTAGWLVAGCIWLVGAVIHDRQARAEG